MSRSRAPFLPAVSRVFELSLGQMLWSRRTVFMAVILAAPIALAVVARVVQAGGVAPIRINGAPVSGAGIFGMMVWILFLRFIVPVLAVFYGTALVADEVEDRTITYLFTRPVARGAILLGKFLAYLACTTLIVLPSVMAVYFLTVPMSGIAATFTSLLVDLGLVALGLMAYGALFACVGAALKRPLIIGLVFAFGWEQAALAMPGYLRRLTLAHYLQALIPSGVTSGRALSVLQAVASDPPTVLVSLLTLCAVTVVSIGAAMRTIEKREYILDQ